MCGNAIGMTPVLNPSCRRRGPSLVGCRHATRHTCRRRRLSRGRVRGMNRPAVPFHGAWPPRCRALVSTQPDERGRQSRARRHSLRILFQGLSLDGEPGLDSLLLPSRPRRAACLRSPMTRRCTAHGLAAGRQGHGRGVLEPSTGTEPPPAHEGHPLPPPSPPPKHQHVRHQGHRRTHSTNSSCLLLFELGLLPLLFLPQPPRMCASTSSPPPVQLWRRALWTSAP